MVYGFVYLANFILSIVLILLLLRRRQSGVSNHLMWMTVMVSFWILTETLSFFVKSEVLALYLQKAKYVSVILIPPNLLIAAIVFIKRIKRWDSWKVWVVFFVPCLSLLSVGTNLVPYPFIQQPQLIYVNDIPIYSYVKNLGFFINAGYSYFLTLITCYLLLMRAIRSPKIYKIQSLFVFIGCALSFLLNVIYITNVFGPAVIDTTPISILMTLLIFYYGVYRLPQVMIVPVARDLVIENMNDYIIVVDNSQCLIDLNPAALDFITQHSHSNLKGAKFKAKLTGMPITDLMVMVPQLQEIKPHMNNTVEKTFEFHDDICGYRYFSVSITPIIDSDHIQIGKLYLIRDMTQIQNYLTNLEELNKELILSDHIIKDALEGILITDAQGNILRVNDSLVKMSGYTKEELLGQNPRIMKSHHHGEIFYRDMWRDILEEGFWEGEIWDRKKSGEVYPKWMSITNIRNDQGEITHFIAISSDISKMKKAENDIELLAYYDSLTKLPNRTLFYDRLKTSLNRCKRTGKGVVLFYMDLDRFKVVNDAYGHAVGDALLIVVAARIKGQIREYDTLSRIGGDEFTLILEDMNTPEDAARVAEKIIQVVQEPFQVMGHEFSIGISIGIALGPLDDMTVEGLFKKADMAMYHAKITNRGTYAFSSDEIERLNREAIEMQTQLKEALENQEFKLFLQPQIAYVEGAYQVVGAEALIRWIKSSGEVVPPGKFIPAAEENGMILKIGNWIIEEMFKIDKTLKDNGISIKLAFNVSVKQFDNDDLILILKEQLAKYQDQNIDLVVEITESMFINDLNKAIHYLNEIKALGVGLALDDFGTGYSSLSYLTQLPVDYLKIDRSFVANLKDQQQRNLTFSIISMAKTMNLRTLAEGVETIEQANTLIGENCDELQGYYFSKPIPLEDFIKFVESMDKKRNISST